MATIKKDGGYNALPISYKRGNPIPLDKSAVWYDKAEMEAYAVSNPTAYVGQVLSYVNETDNKVEVYVIINEAGELELLNLADQKADKDSVYTKTEIDTKIGEIIVEGSHLRREILDEVPSEEKPLSSLIDVNSENALNTIYMVKTGLEDDSNKYNEYIVIEKDGNRFIEPVGSWEVNLNDYVTKDEFSKIPLDGEKNVINSIDTTEFNINNDGADRQLQIKEISHQKVAGLEELLNEKRNVSDKVPVADLSGLDTWLTSNGAELIQNIGVSNLSDELQAIIGNSIELKVNTDQFNFTNGVLNLKDAFVEVSLQDFQSTVGNLETMLEEGFNVYNEIKSIQDSLTWKDLNS